MAKKKNEDDDRSQEVGEIEDRSQSVGEGGGRFQEAGESWYRFKKISECGGCLQEVRKGEGHSQEVVEDGDRSKYEIDEQLSILSGRINAIDTLRKANKDNHAHVLEICRTHFQLSSTSTIIVKIIDTIVDGNKIHNMMGTNVTNLREGRQKQTIVVGAKSLSDVVPCLLEIKSMGGNSIYNIV